MSDLEKVIVARDKLIETAKTLIVVAQLADGEGGGPDLGFSPFIRDDEGCFYIYTSQLSAHVRALLQGNAARFMLAADESASQNIWARVRLKFEADIIAIARDDSDFATKMDWMQDALGPTMGLIRNFSDFHLFKITPTTGILVTGFAAAYAVTGLEFTITEHLSQS